ncbi:MAG: radical SAM protein [Spirochaetales bacterium]|nr:radical SAM protein [Spirochaetales bacterium]
MRVVLVQPSLEDFYATPHRLSALGGFSIKALLEKQGHSVELINFPLMGKKPRKTALPDYASHLTPYLLEEKGPVSYFTDWCRWGPDPNASARIILDKSPDLVLVSLFAYAYGEEALALGRAIKELSRPGQILPIVVGGAGVTVRPEYFTAEPSLDLILAGEGEVLFSDYTLEDIRALALGPTRLIRGERYCEAGEMIPLFSSTSRGRNHVQVATLLSRGCPRGCRFCSNHLTQGKRMRRIEPAQVEEAFCRFLRQAELDRNNKLTLDLEDDNLLMNKNYFRDVLERLNRVWCDEGRNGEDLFFTAENGMDYELLDRDLLVELCRKGFRQFNFSLASANPQLAERENRFYRPDALAEHLAFLKEKEIPSVTYFISGLAGDSRVSTAEALSFLASLPTTLGISLFYAVPGLPGFDGHDPLGGNPAGMCRGSLAYPWNGTLSTESLITAFRLSRLINLLKDRSQAAFHEDLIASIFRDNRLYTYDRHKKKIPVVHQDGDLVKDVLNSITFR